MIIGSGRKEAKASEYLEEIGNAMDKGQSVVDWRNRDITGVQAVTLFECIGKAVSDQSWPQSSGSLAIDLADNRMGDLDVNGLQKIFGFIKDAEWLRVRFGCEIVQQRILEALKESQMSDAWGLRVQQDEPWRNPVYGLFNELKAQTEQMMELTKEIKSISASTTRKLENYMENTASGLEDQISRCLARSFAGEVIASGYKWKKIIKGKAGDMDCCVLATIMNQRVLILGEVKHNMEEKYGEAIKQVFDSFDRWQQLLSTSPPSANDVNFNVYKSLQVDLVKKETPRIIFALGGHKFADSVDEDISETFEGYTSQMNIFKSLQWLHQGKMPWIKVVLDTNDIKFHNMP